MATAPPAVAVTVETDAAARLRALAGRLPIWAADTPANRAAATALLAAGRAAGPAPAVTLFGIVPDALPDSWVVAALDAIVARHAALAHDPPLAALELYGVLVSDALRAALADHGLSEVTSDGDAVLARAPAASP